MMHETTNIKLKAAYVPVVLNHLVHYSWNTSNVVCCRYMIVYTLYKGDK